MKKFLKVFIIVLLVLAVIGGTVYFFFRKHKEENNTTTSIAAMLQSESKLKFNDDLRVVESIIENSNSTDLRMNLIVTTNEKLDEVVYSLTSYYIESETKINNEQIAKQMSVVNSSRNLLSDMMREYNIKKDSSYFDKHVGANDLYLQSCSYLIEYATLANLINQSITNVDKNADIKFNMFEIYANVVVNTFSSTKMVDIKSTPNKNDDDITVVENLNNIEIVNDILKIRNLNVVKIKNENTESEIVELLFTAYNNDFSKHYNNCNKNLFAENFAKNMSSSSEATEEEIAIKYLKLIYGI